MSSPDFAKLKSRLKHIVIEAVTPNVDSGRFAVKRIVGEDCVVEADIFRDGPAALAAVVKWRRACDSDFSEARMEHIENDRWHGKFPLLENTGYVFTIEAWTRSFHSWREYYLKKVAAGMNITSDVSEGIALLNGMKQHAPYEDSLLLAESIEQLRAIGDSPMGADIVATASLESAVDRNEDRADRTLYDILLPVTADRPLARFSAWYEIFPRSQGTRAGEHATLREAEERLSDIKDMGFDVVYVAPVHPIGATHRKGPNNSLVAEPDSPGSPWAIGSRAGGHTAVEPLLGTLDDFDHFVLVAERLGLEIALDLAIQCSPDHPWVIEHPSWFRHRPDGSIKFAENPPKQYQDIYPIDFDSSDQADLIEELLNVVLFWISHGVRIFRVDNPHTKPVAFWEWLIARVHEKHPDVLFLAEAFTRPKMMNVLAKAGFTQSYTYFTWRNTKSELTEYLTELTTTGMVDYFRPNFFTNTPDILPPILQHGGPPAFKSRLILAATLSSSYGIYSGYELFENEAIPGTEEYANSEKYEIKVRDWKQPNSLREYVSRLNSIRRVNPALQQFANLRFLTTDNDQIILYVKWSDDRSNVILVAVNLDPHNPHHCTAFVPTDAISATAISAFTVTDLITGASYNWGTHNYVRLEPTEPAHVLRVTLRP